MLTHLSVVSSKPVVGGWYWFSNQELHYRPQQFWPAHEHVTATWDLTGWNAGSGMWGAGAGSTQFDIGDAHVAYADLGAHKMTVTDDGHAIATYPISGGKPTDPTMDGVHIVLDRSSVVRMNSATNGVPVNSPDGYDELVYSDVHISDSGEYVHAAPWSVGSQGRVNVSHGCINLSPANALAFFGIQPRRRRRDRRRQPAPARPRRPRRHGLGHELVVVLPGRCRPAADGRHSSARLTSRGLPVR